MENNKQLTTSGLFGDKSIQQRFEKLLGKKAQGFISSVLQVVNNNAYLKKADPNTVLNAAATAASLDLPINQNLGFAWIVPYKGKAQFQMGWKGYVQLALRTGQYKRINVTEVYENQFQSFNRLTEELIANFDKPGEGNVVGYAAFFSLVNGMEKTTYWSKEEVIAHAKKYSQAFGSSSSPWQDKDQFHAMAKKTVLKNMISKWGIMSVEMQTAHLADQAVQEEEDEFNYIDNTIEVQSNEEESNRVIAFIEKADSLADLEAIKKEVPEDLFATVQQEYDNRENELIIESGK